MTESTAGSLIVRREGPLAWLVVNRPAAHNALNAEVWRGLTSAFRALQSEIEVRVIILRGAGDEAFISGADITEFTAIRANAEMAAAYDQLAGEALQALMEAPQPVIAMINGLCYGGGLLIALICDLRFASEQARFAIPASRLGLAYPMERGVERLIQVVGPTHAADILLSGRTLEAAEAWRIGLVNRVVAPDELEQMTIEYALHLAESAPLTLAAHKLELQQALLPHSERDYARIQAAIQRCAGSADYQEGIAAFLEKRKPRFTGR
jgi:enoyl-CoA hydratase/carnithine racemase